MPDLLHIADARQIDLFFFGFGADPPVVIERFIQEFERPTETWQQIENTSANRGLNFVLGNELNGEIGEVHEPE